MLSLAIISFPPLAAFTTFFQSATTFPSSVYITMDDTARSFLVDLMTRSKKGLSFAEQLCSQAREELDACQGHSDEIEKIYSKLCFLSHQIKIQIAVHSSSSSHFTLLSLTMVLLKSFLIAYQPSLVSL